MLLPSSHHFSNSPHLSRFAARPPLLCCRMASEARKICILRFTMMGGARYCRVIFGTRGWRGVRVRGIRIALLLSGLVFCSACAGRAPQLVATVQPQDRHMDCAAIMAEVQSNNDRVQELATEQGWKVAQNVAAGVAGFVIPVLWFGMDWQGAASKEAQALQNRQQYLATLAEQRNCGGPARPPGAYPPPSRRP